MIEILGWAVVIYLGWKLLQYTVIGIVALFDELNDR